MLKNRDAKTKQMLIDYLNKDTDERLWQAIANWGEQNGLINHFLCTDGAGGFEDLFYREADEWLERDNNAKKSS